MIVDIELTVARPREQMFDLMADARNEAEWNSTREPWAGRRRPCPDGADDPQELPPGARPVQGVLRVPLTRSRRASTRSARVGDSRFSRFSRRRSRFSSRRSRPDPGGSRYSCTPSISSGMQTRSGRSPMSTNVARGRVAPWVSGNDGADPGPGRVRVPGRGLLQLDEDDMSGSVTDVLPMVLLRGQPAG